MRYFSSPGSLRRPMDSGGDDPKGPGFPIRISADQSLFAAPHGFSQRTTSFIASRCQGIHQTPLRRLIDPTSNGQRPGRPISRWTPPDAGPKTGPRQHCITQSARPNDPRARSRPHRTTSTTEPSPDRARPVITLFTMSNSTRGQRPEPGAATSRARSSDQAGKLAFRDRAGAP